MAEEQRADLKERRRPYYRLFEHLSECFYLGHCTICCDVLAYSIISVLDLPRYPRTYEGYMQLTKMERTKITAFQKFIIEFFSQMSNKCEKLHQLVKDARIDPIGYFSRFAMYVLRLPKEKRQALLKKFPSHAEFDFPDWLKLMEEAKHG